MQLLCGMTEEAAKSFDAAIAVAARLAAADPENIQSQRDLAVYYGKAMLGYQQSGDLVRWREASERSIEGFMRVYEATAGDAASKQDLVNTLSQACDGYFAFSNPTPSDVSVTLSRAQQMVKLSDQPDAGRIRTLATFQFLSGDVTGAVATVEKALVAVPDRPESATMRAELNRQLEEYRQALAVPPVPGGQ